MLSTKFVYQKAIFLYLLVLVSITGKANEAIYIGHVSSLQNEVITRTAETGEEKLQLNDKLYFKQQIITKENAKAVVTFRDGSTFAIAPKSVVVLDEFIFNPAENVSEKSVKVLKGTFRYISGFAIKNAKTEIQTPFGTAGIRGSSDEGNVNLSKQQFTFLVSSGEATITSPNGKKSQTVVAGQSLQSSDKGVFQLSDADVAIVAQLFVETLGTEPPPTLTAEQIREDAKNNNLPVETQKSASDAAKEVPVNPEDLKGGDLTIPIDKEVNNIPKTDVKTHIQDLQNQNKLQTSEATKKIVEAAIKDNPSTAAAIVSAAVTANPSLAVAITSAAIIIAPDFATAITSAAAYAMSAASVTPNAVASMIEAVVDTLKENPATTNIVAQLKTNVQEAVIKGQITPEQAAAIITEINNGNIQNPVSSSPN